MAQSVIAATQTDDIKKRIFMKASPSVYRGRHLRPAPKIWQARINCFHQGAAIKPLCDGRIARCATAGQGNCAAMTSLTVPDRNEAAKLAYGKS
jgi:hypothetical protein